MWRPLLLLLAAAAARPGPGPPPAVLPTTVSPTTEPGLTAPPTTDPPTTLEPNRNNYIKVKGGSLELVYVDGARLALRCGPGALHALECLPPPPAPLRTRVRNLTVVDCAPPTAGYSAALERLGVRLLPAGTVALELPGPEPLTGAALAGFAPTTLRLRASAAGLPPPAPRALLAPLRALRRLEVRDVPLEPDALAAAPALTALTLVDAGPALVPAATLRSLTSLVAGAEVRLEAGSAPALRVLSLDLAEGGAPPPLASFPALETLSLTGWDAREPGAWGACGALRTLTLTLVGFESLPERWAAACGALSALELQNAHRLSALPPRLLEGACGREGEGELCPAPALTRLVLRFGALTSLPEKLFDPVPNLRYLDLKHNKLKTLPSAIFATPTALTHLILAENDFLADVFQRLSVLRRLRLLDLAGNRRLGDACPGGRHLRSEDSLLKELSELEDLILSRTAVTRICRDWRLAMPRLARLRLESTRVTHLAYDDLQLVRDNSTAARGARVVLLDAPVRSLAYSAEDELRARAAPPARVRVELSRPLACDCESFRAVRALRAWPAHAVLGGALRCADGSSLPAASLDDMLCPAPAWCAALPAACTCAAREQGPPGAPRHHVRVTCGPAAGLRAVPALPSPASPATPVEWDLRLAGNDIVELDRLPANLTALDVRDCGLRRASAEAAAALGGLARLRLAGNPLECGCAAAPLLEAAAALRRRAPFALDAARCADGRPLPPAAPCDPGGGAGALWALGAVLALLTLAGAALSWSLARGTRRALLKRVLLRWGWLPRANSPDPARPYDVFVSFAHADAGEARALAARLEAGAAPLRLCLHSRDWAPGEYIDAQIAASVRGARRTLALVSRAWLRSRWARVELREALAGDGGGLVLVLLEEASALAELDRELRRCMARCTYLPRDHPHFWERLREALPRPAPPAPAPRPPGD